MKYVSDAGNELKNTPVSTSLGLAGAAAATFAATRHLKLDTNPALQALAFAAVAAGGFLATYAGARLADKGASLARSKCSYFGGSDAAAPSNDVELKEVAPRCKK